MSSNPDEATVVRHSLLAGKKFKIEGGIAPCPQATAVVTVNVSQPADPGVDGSTTVSYTHLTLPTILRVQINEHVVISDYTNMRSYDQVNFAKDVKPGRQYTYTAERVGR